MSPCLYLLTGISFAGKSVLARRLAAHLGAPRVDPDEVSHRFGLGLAGEFLSDTQWVQIHAMAEEEACTHLRGGASVVYDTTAFTRAQRDALRDLATRCGATTRLIFVDTPRDIARQRWHANEQSPQRARVHPDDFAMVADLFEPPSHDESALRFTPEDDADTCVLAHVEPEIGAVLFDLDNTLADRRAAFSSWAHWFVCDQLGLTSTLATEKAVDALIRLDRDGYCSREDLFQAVKGQFPQPLPDVPSMVDAFREQFSGHVPPLTPGNLSLLNLLDEANIPWGIVSNGSSRSQRAKLRQLGLETRAVCVLISGEVGLRKPEVAIFQQAVAHLGVEPRSTLFVGDHPEIDIVGASRAGMLTAWLHHGRTWPEELRPLVPDYGIKELLDLSVLLRAGRAESNDLAPDE